MIMAAITPLPVPGCSKCGERLFNLFMDSAMLFCSQLMLSAPISVTPRFPYYVKSPASEGMGKIMSHKTPTPTKTPSCATISVM